MYQLFPRIEDCLDLVVGGERIVLYKRVCNAHFAANSDCEAAKAILELFLLEERAIDLRMLLLSWLDQLAVASGPPPLPMWSMNL